MIVVTGAVGFIGSQLIRTLNKIGYTAIIAVDEFSNPLKNKNLHGAKVLHKIDRLLFFDWLKSFKKGDIQMVFHLGARTDTLERSTQLFERLNLEYSKAIWKLCARFEIVLIYASSAATYGNGDLGYAENVDLSNLKPLTPYASSKHLFDLWAGSQKESPVKWYGLKFFNVFGSNETHKGKMASMVYQSYQQIKNSGEVKLFKSHKANFEHGGQMRDFVYIHDVVNLCTQLMAAPIPSGLLNVATGSANDFNYLVKCVFESLGLKKKVVYVDMPVAIRDQYQYFTQADMTKCNSFGLLKEPIELSEGIKAYISQLRMN